MEVKGRAFSSCVLASGIVVLFAVAPLAQPPPLPPSSLPLQLTGVMTDDQAGVSSVCFIRCLNADERRGALGVGDVACGLAKIEEIHEKGLVLRNIAANRLELLAFPPDTRTTATRPPAFVVPVPAAAASTATKREEAPATITVEVPKTTVERYLSNLNDLLQSALAVPHYAEAASGQRTMDGFAISRVTEGGAAEQVGLRDGDVVQEINGHPLDSMATAMALFGGMPTMTQATVRLVRAGRPITILVTVK